ncbi:MAG: ABC transporter permease [Bacteroidetes bacterium]|nr:ABC transporter permease [Bacteroidota bacterium]
MIEFFIARRYLKSKHTVNYISIISFISTLGITIGVAALIVVLSVFNGFGSLVKSILINFDPHIRISVVSDSAYIYINELEKELSSNAVISSFSPFVEGKAILLNKKSYEVFNLKGISDYNNKENGIGSAVVSGEFDLDSGSGNDKLIISFPIALRLSTRVGDKISATSFNNIEKSFFSLSLPRNNLFEVNAIFETNNKDYDNSYVFTSLKSAQKFLGMGQKISGYEIILKDINNSEDVKNNLEAKFGDNIFSIKTWYDLHSDLYSVMLIERWAAYIILCLIIAVATFNILGSLSMSVIEKKKDIGLLRTMGTTEKSILRIFMFEGLLIGAIGTISGVILGIIICYMQIEFNFYPLDPMKYIINYMPVEIRISDIIAISFMSMFLSTIAALYPAKRAAKTSIVDSIKWE